MKGLIEANLKPCFMGPWGNKWNPLKFDQTKSFSSPKGTKNDTSALPTTRGATGEVFWPLEKTTLGWQLTFLAAVLSTCFSDTKQEAFRIFERETQVFLDLHTFWEKMKTKKEDEIERRKTKEKKKDEWWIDDDMWEFRKRAKNSPFSSTRAATRKKRANSTRRVSQLASTHRVWPSFDLSE